MGKARQHNVVVFCKYCSLIFKSPWALGSNPGSPSYSCGTISKMLSFIFPT